MTSTTALVLDIVVQRRRTRTVGKHSCASFRIQLGGIETCDHGFVYRAPRIRRAQTDTARLTNGGEPK